MCHVLCGEPNVISHIFCSLGTLYASLNKQGGGQVDPFSSTTAPTETYSTLLHGECCVRNKTSTLRTWLYPSTMAVCLTWLTMSLSDGAAGSGAGMVNYASLGERSPGASAEYAALSHGTELMLDLHGMSVFCSAHTHR